MSGIPLIPGQEEPAVSAASAQPATMFTTAGTDITFWLDKAGQFAKKYFDLEVRLCDLFAIPEELPWQSVVPVFDPGNLSNRDTVSKALKGQKLTVYEEVDVMGYSNSASSGSPSLHLIQNSVRPDVDTMGLSPNDLRATSRSYLGLRGYALAFGVHHFATGGHLDPETFTWFPEDRLPGGGVASGFWSPGRRRVGFSWGSAGSGRPFGGARLAIPVSLKS